MIFLSLRSTFYSRPIFYFLKKEENILSNEKLINSRQQQKHDIEANWIKAINFIPKDGEIIVYDKDENHATPRIKIGNGEQTVNQLPFISEEILNKFNEFSPIGVTEEEEGHIIFEGVYYGDSDLSSVITYTPQTLTEEQKAQARENIGGASEERLGAVEESLETKLNKPVTWVGKPQYILGVRNNGDICTTTASNACSSDAIARYDSNGMLYSKGYNQQTGVYENSVVVTNKDLYGVAYTHDIWAYQDVDGYATDDDFNEACSFIYDNYRTAILHIEVDDFYKQVVGATVQWDEETGENTSIIFGDNEYIWYAGTDDIVKIEKEKKYELIETVTLTEEVKTVVRNHELDGTPYKLEAVMLKITAPKATEDQQGYCYMYGSDGGRVAGAYFSGMISSTGERTSTYIAYPLYGNWFSYSLGSAYDAGNTAQVYNYPKLNGSRTTTEYPYITGVQTYVKTAFPVGTTIKIWGVRA